MGNRVVQCEILDLQLKQRFRTTRISFDERTAFKLHEHGKVRLLDVISTFSPQRTDIGNFDRSKPLVVWFEDQPGQLWGAEYSSRRVIEAGVALGHQIHHMGQKNFDANLLATAGLVVLNNIAFLSEPQLRLLLSVLYEQAVPYVRYEHDAFFCVHRSPLCRGRLKSSDVQCRNCAQTKFHYYPRRMLMWKLFAGSVLNVFISPLQHEIHMRALGEVVNPSILLTPPVDTQHFRPVPGVERKKNLAVSMTGKIWYANKGLQNLLAYAESNPKMRFEVYTKPHPHMLSKLKSMPNVLVKGVVDYAQLPAIYSRAAKVVHLPSWPEAAGRTLVEGYLCGCSPVMNDNCGVFTFDLPWKDRDAVVKIIENGPNVFWAEVSRVMRWATKEASARALL